MAQAVAYLKDVKPFKTSWLVQVRVLHTWKTYTTAFGETFDMVLADVQGTKIHASVKKDCMNRFEKNMIPGEWRNVQNFELAYAAGQFRPTDHRYKMSFLTQTILTRIDPLSADHYLSLTSFNNVITGGLNTNILIDIVGQVVNVGGMEIIDVNNKPTKKISFQLRDEMDERLPCTLWGSFAEQIFQACENASTEMVICLIRFAKIKTYKDIRSIANSFNTSKVVINPDYPKILEFKNKLPNDGLALTVTDNKPQPEVQLAVGIEFCLQFPRKTIQEVFEMFEVGRVKVICTIYAIDIDWVWYYIACRKCNKKVIQVVTTALKPQFYCDSCKGIVTNVQARYKLHVNVMDQTGQMKLMLFDSMASEIVGCPASNLLNGSLVEIDDPEDLPDSIKQLVGKTFQYLICVGSENLFNGLDTYKVSKVLSNSTMNEEEIPDDSNDQGSLMLTCSQDLTGTSTPSSKRSLTEDLSSPSDQSPLRRGFALIRSMLSRLSRKSLAKKK